MSHGSMHMNARLKQYAAPWLIALGLLANAPAHADQSAGLLSTATSTLAQPAARAANALSRLAWDRVGAPMQGMA